MLMWSLSGNTFFQGRFLFPTQWDGIWGSEGKPSQVIQCIRAYFSKVFNPAYCSSSCRH